MIEKFSKYAELTLSVDELPPVVQVLKDALVRRPIPDGVPCYDLRTALDCCDEYFCGIRAISEADANFSSDDLLDAVESMAAGYHSLWACRFPLGLEVGQPLFSAVLERPMRDLVRVLEPCQAEDGDDFPFEMVTLDAEDELKCFNSWHDSLQSYQQLQKQPGSGCDFSDLAISFLLGWWLGRG